MGDRPLDDEEAEVVRAAGAEVEGIEIPAKFQAAVWRRMLTVVSMFWDREGRVPSAAEAHRAWPQIPEVTYQLGFAEDEFRRALRLRGIEVELTDSLSDLQYTAILKLTDPSDRRSERAKLASLGVSWPRYQAWLKNPVFTKAKRDKSEELLADVQDAALIRLRGNVEAGEQRAIEYTLAVTGRYNPANLAIRDARQVVMMVVESVLKHVSSPEEREAILNDVRAQTAAFDLNNRKALEG